MNVFLPLPLLTARGLLSAAAFLVLFLQTSAAAHGWGRDGHRIVCEMAWQELEPGVRRSLQRLLPAEGRYSRFSEACLWADEVRGDDDLPQYEPDEIRHYVNITPGDEQIDLARHCPERCVVEGIELYSRVLAGQPEPQRSRGEALLFLAHFVGDLHQPLHAGYAEDRGGNDLSVRYHGRDPECNVRNGNRRCRYNLHSVWDTWLVADILSDDNGIDSWKDLARYLRAKIRAQDRRAWLASEVPLDWANESALITTTRVYPFEDGDTLGWDYFREHRGTVETRLQQAAVRLAALLTRILE